MANLYLADLHLEGCEPHVKTQLVRHVAQTHQSVSDGIVTYFERYRRNVYVTPKSFLSFLTAYMETYVKKKDGLAELVVNHPPVNALTVAGWFDHVFY